MRWPGSMRRPIPYLFSAYIDQGMKQSQLSIFFFLFTKLTTGSYLRKRDVESPKSAYFDGPSIFSASSNSNHLGGKNCAVNCFLHVISIFFPHEKSLNNDQDKPIELLSCTDASELPPGNSLLFNHIN